MDNLCSIDSPWLFHASVYCNNKSTLNTCFTAAVIRFTATNMGLSLDGQMIYHCCDYCCAVHHLRDENGLAWEVIGFHYHVYLTPHWRVLFCVVCIIQAADDVFELQ